MTSRSRYSITALVVSFLLQCVGMKAGESVPALRISALAGVSIPVGAYDPYETGLTYALGVDMPIGESGVFAGIGFTTFRFKSEELLDKFTVSALYAGAHFLLNSAADPVSAYLNLNIGIDTDTWQTVYLMPGIGADFSLSKRLALFVEVTPTFPTPPSRLGWIPVRGGVRFLIPS